MALAGAGSGESKAAEPSGSSVAELVQVSRQLLCLSNWVKNTLCPYLLPSEAIYYLTSEKTEGLLGSNDLLQNFLLIRTDFLTSS